MERLGVIMKTTEKKHDPRAMKFAEASILLALLLGLTVFIGVKMKINMVYRGYRVPYEWIPQLEKPEEKAIPLIDNTRFKVPGSPRKKALRVTKVKSDVRGFRADSQLCVIDIDTK